MTTVVPELKTGRSLVPTSVFDRLTARLAKDEQVNEKYAMRVMDQALAFIHTCAHSDLRLSPCNAVDLGWHTFILDTVEYERFCARTFGFFVHHVPIADDDRLAHGVEARAAIERTVAEMRRVRFAVDDELWKSAPGDCSQCHNGCADSPASPDQH
ncbi:hypothetical protein [Actinophytocola sp.]|jgi:hypothetical protein|uniref:glycine-rich domain-containing protein n=1 Tax=Actinophytocola sp. TaxID=1872138 RepID=UPI002EDA96D9